MLARLEKTIIALLPRRPSPMTGDFNPVPQFFITGSFSTLAYHILFWSSERMWFNCQTLNHLSLSRATWQQLVSDTFGKIASASGNALLDSFLSIGKKKKIPPFFFSKNEKKMYDNYSQKLKKKIQNKKKTKKGARVRAWPSWLSRFFFPVGFRVLLSAGRFPILRWRRGGPLAGFPPVRPSACLPASPYTIGSKFVYNLIARVATVVRCIVRKKSSYATPGGHWTKLVIPMLLLLIEIARARARWQITNLSSS